MPSAGFIERVVRSFRLRRRRARSVGVHHHRHIPSIRLFYSEFDPILARPQALYSVTNGCGSECSRMGRIPRESTTVRTIGREECKTGTNRGGIILDCKAM